MNKQELDKLSNKEIILKYGKLLYDNAITREQYNRIVTYCKNRPIDNDLLKEVVEVFT